MCLHFPVIYSDCKFFKTISVSPFLTSQHQVPTGTEHALFNTILPPTQTIKHTCSEYEPMTGRAKDGKRNKMLIKLMKFIIFLKFTLALNASTKEIKAGKTCTCKTVYIHSEQAPGFLTERNQRKETILGISCITPLQSSFLLITAATLLPPLLFSLANFHPRTHWSKTKPKLTEALPQLFHSVLTSPPPGGNMSIEIITAPERGVITQNAYSNRHTRPQTTLDLGQHAVKNNYSESQSQQNNTCRGCHLLDLSWFLPPCFRKTPWQNLSQIFVMWGPGHHFYKS